MKRALQISTNPAGYLRHPAFPVLLAALAFGLIGLGLPPRSADAGVGPVLGGTDSTAQLAPAEDPDAFRTMSRWGTDIQSVENDRSETDDQLASGLNPELVKLGFIGLTLTTDEDAVMLTHPDGRTVRLTGGDSLPDGRTLVLVTDNALTLEDDKGQRQTLVLFPRLAESETNDE